MFLILLFTLKMICSIRAFTYHDLMTDNNNNNHIRHSSEKSFKCQPITVPMCMNLPYNSTRMPNHLNHATQEEAGMEAHQFFPLVKVGCSAELQFFLCSIYTPICLPDYDKPLPVCRPVCERVRNKCSPIMAQHGFPWPAHFDCDQFPIHGQPDQLCMDSAQQFAQQPSPTLLPPTESADKDVTMSTSGAKKLDNKNPCSCDCDRSSDFATVRRDEGRYLQIYNVSYCSYRCVAKESENLNVWLIGLLSILGLASSLFFISTILIDFKRFDYPDRPMIGVQFSYLVVSIGYILRFLFDNDRTVCQNDRYGNRLKVGILGDVDFFSICNVQFVAVYFFETQAMVWWVVLSFCWFLTSTLMWSPEAVAAQWKFYLFLAWSIPSALTTFALVARKIDVDPHLAICSAGNTSLETLVYLFIIPLAICLLLCLVFLFSSIFSLNRLRKILRRQNSGKFSSSRRDSNFLQKTANIQRLMFKLLFYGLVFIVPFFFLLLCHLFDHIYRADFQRQKLCDCHDEKDQILKDFYPKILICKHYSIFLAVLSSTVWFLSAKSWRSWRRFFTARFCFSSEKDEQRDQKIAHFSTSSIKLTTRKIVNAGSNSNGPFWDNLDYYRSLYENNCTSQLLGPSSSSGYSPTY